MDVQIKLGNNYFTPNRDWCSNIARMQNSKHRGWLSEDGKLVELLMLAGF